MEIAILGVIICQLLLSLFALIAGTRLILSLLRNVRLFFEPREEGKSSPAADIGKALADEAANRLASAIIASLKAWLLSQNSIAVRQDKAAAREEFEANAPPFLALIAKYAPGIGKVMNRNPELAALAFNALQKQGGGPAKNSGNNGSGDFNKI